MCVKWYSCRTVNLNLGLYFPSLSYLTNYVIINTFIDWLVEAVGRKKFAGRVVSILHQSITSKTTRKLWFSAGFDVMECTQYQEYQEVLTKGRSVRSSRFWDQIKSKNNSRKDTENLSVELGFIVCFLHIMHICHARHYWTLRNWKRRRRRIRIWWKECSDDVTLSLLFSAEFSD